MFTKQFKELGKHDANIAGGKGASLGEMTGAGFPVPGGFVVLAEAFDYFLEFTQLAAEVDSILKEARHDELHSVEVASEKIRELIENTEIPKNIELEVLEAFEKLNAKFVAVRSSATAEDSSAASWAGELESYLNTSKSTLLPNIKRCWASLFTPRAIFYRFEKGMHTSKVSVAVVIQKMIQSEISGITFTVHPVTEDKNQMVIEAGYGLGEAIVGGIITPDNYVTTKDKHEILDRYVSEQTKAIKRGEGGTKEVKIAEEKQSLQKLSDEEIIKLSKICARIEEHYKFPCDIEWAYEGGKFYIVQSRPITTLSN